MQGWLEGWLTENQIAYTASHTQMPPDIYLDPNDLTINLMEVKAFNYDVSPAFDIAEPLAYWEEIVRNSCMLYTKYLVGRYEMDDNSGIITIRDMWLKSCGRLLNQENPPK